MSEAYYVLREVCKERHNSIRAAIAELKMADKETLKAIDRNFTNFKKEIVNMVIDASQSKLKVETGMKSKDKAMVLIALITSITSIAITLIQVLG